MNQKNEKKTQHYVPKFYLRNFTDKKNCISTYIYSKDKFIKNASFDSVANEEYFYGKDLVIEKALSVMEGEWAKSFEIIIKNNEQDYSNKEVAKIIDDIYTFIGFQLSRTLKIYDSQIDLKNFLTNYITAKSSSIEAANSSLKKYFPDNFNPMLVPMQIAFFVKNLFRDLTPIILYNKTNIDFITSDNPVILYNRFLANKNYKGNYGLGAKGLCLLLPLSPDILLCLYDHKIYFPTDNHNYYEPTTENVLEINKLICRNAYDSIFLTPNHDENYAKQLKNSFVNNLEWRTSTAESNIGEIIVVKGQSILEEYSMPFLTIKKASKKVVVPEFGPAPRRNN